MNPTSTTIGDYSYNLLPTYFSPIFGSSSKNTDKSINQKKKIYSYGIIYNTKMYIYKCKICNEKLLEKRVKEV
jgi:hypothetical protein